MLGAFLWEMGTSGGQGAVLGSNSVQLAGLRELKEKEFRHS